MVRSFDRNRFLASCCVSDEPPWRRRRPRIDHQCARGAGDVDAEMIVEAAVFGGENRLDQVSGKSSSGMESSCLMPRWPIGLP
jgi:hypothetical protein